MTKTKPLTKVQQLERRIENLEYAIYQAYNDGDEVFAMLRMLRSYVASDDYSKYTARDAINGIFTVALNNQSMLMDNAELEY